MGGTRIFESSFFLVKHLPLGPTSERQAKRNGQVCRDVSSASIATSMFFFRPFGYHVAEQKPCNRQWGLIVRQKKRSAFQGLMYFEKNMSKLTKRLLKIHLRGDLKLKNGVLEEFILSSFLTVLWCCSLGAVHFSVYIYIYAVQSLTVGGNPEKNRSRMEQSTTIWHIQKNIFATVNHCDIRPGFHGITWRIIPLRSSNW